MSKTIQIPRPSMGRIVLVRYAIASIANEGPAWVVHVNEDDPTEIRALVAVADGHAMVVASHESSPPGAEMLWRYPPRENRTIEVPAPDGET